MTNCHCNAYRFPHRKNSGYCNPSHAQKVNTEMGWVSNLAAEIAAESFQEPPTPPRPTVMSPEVGWTHKQLLSVSTDNKHFCKGYDDAFHGHGYRHPKTGKGTLGYMAGYIARQTEELVAYDRTYPPIF